MAEEYTQAIIELWTEENPEFEGKYVSFKDVAFEPKCVQKPHVPIWFCGDADAVLRRTALMPLAGFPSPPSPRIFPHESTSSSRNRTTTAS